MAGAKVAVLHSQLDRLAQVGNVCSPSGPLIRCVSLEE